MKLWCFFMRYEGGEQMSLRPTRHERNRQEERYLAAHISESVKSTRHPRGHVSVAADVTRPSLGTIRDILEQERTCLYVPRSTSLYVYIYTRVHTLPCRITCTRHTQKSVARSGNVWVPSTLWWMRRVWRNVIGTDTRGNALTFLSCFFVLIHTSRHTHIPRASFYLRRCILPRHCDLEEAISMQRISIANSCFISSIY